MEVYCERKWPKSSGGRYFDYLFYIDFEASMAEPRAQFALGHLQVSLYISRGSKLNFFVPYGCHVGFNATF